MRADLTISITWRGSKFTIIPHRNIFCNIQCMACTHTMCNTSFCPMYCIHTCLIISANTVITKYLDNMYFVVLYVITGHHVMLATATKKIKMCLETYLFLSFFFFLVFAFFFLFCFFLSFLLLVFAFIFPYFLLFSYFPFFIFILV